MADKTQKLVKCPVCGEKYWNHALKLHITNTGKVELYQSMKNMMERSRNKPYTFSPLIVLRHSPHYQFRKKHLKVKKVFEIKFEL